MLPDIIFMDGGKGHVSAALEVIDETGLDIPVVGMVKDDRHRTRALVYRTGRRVGAADGLAMTGRVPKNRIGAGGDRILPARWMDMPKYPSRKAYAIQIHRAHAGGSTQICYRISS